MHTSSPLVESVRTVARLLPLQNTDRAGFFTQLLRVMKPLVTQKAWLSAELMVPDAEHYRREVLFDDADGRFTIACLTWAPGQCTPIHDHHAWGVVGLVQGMLRSETFARTAAGEIYKRAADEMLIPGAITTVDPLDAARADIHRLGSASPEVSVSIHIYGCLLDDINYRHYEDPARQQRANP